MASTQVNEKAKDKVIPTQYATQNLNDKLADVEKKYPEKQQRNSISKTLINKASQLGTMIRNAKNNVANRVQKLNPLRKKDQGQGRG
ncbi:MAG: hypothetical protein H6909_04895 [Rickettsiaceae bacterium]|nr:hypothetical protein [Rickettsiaceae bacterium]